MNKFNLIVLLFFFIATSSNSKSEEIDCSAINSKTHEIIDTKFGVKYCFNAGKFLLINQESKNQIWTYNLEKFRNSYLHSFEKIDNEGIKKFEKEFAEISPHVLYFNDEGTLHTSLIYNHFHQENFDNTRIVIKDSTYDTNQVIGYLTNNINEYCEGEKNQPLIKASYIVLECGIIDQENKNIVIFKLAANYNEKTSKKAKQTIQFLLSDFKVINLKTTMTRYDVFYSFKNKDYFLNIVSVCNEYLPKRSCENENQQLDNMIGNLIFLNG